MINKINSENKLEIQKLKNEYFEKIDDKISEKFYNLTEETKNKNNQNHNSSLNHSSNENEINKNNRNDSQIKLHGFRIELKEIEKVILNNSNINDAIVVKKDDYSNKPILVAYVILKNKNYDIF